MQLKQKSTSSAEKPRYQNLINASMPIIGCKLLLLIQSDQFLQKSSLLKSAKKKEDRFRVQPIHKYSLYIDRPARAIKVSEESRNTQSIKN